MSEVRNGEQKEKKLSYSEIFYGGQKLHKYFSALLIRGTSLLTCSYIGELRNGQKFKWNRVATKVRTYFEMRTDGQRFFV